MESLKLLVKTSRPVSWVNTAYPFALGYLLMGGALDARFVIGAVFFLIPYNLLMYGINDVFDYESDIRNPRKGGIEGAITPRVYHPLIVWVSVLLSAPFVVALFLLGSTASMLVLAILLFFVVAYSVKGLRFKEIPLLDSITSSIHFVGPLIFAYALVGSTPAGWTAAGAFFLWGIASQAFGAVQDISPDREANLKSIATVFGAKWTVRFSAVLYLLASVLCAAIGGLAVLVGFFGLLYVVNVLPYWSTTDKRSPQTNIGWKRFLWINYVVGAVVTMCCMVLFIQ